MPDIQYVGPVIPGGDAEIFHLLADYGRHVMRIVVHGDNTISVAAIEDTFVSGTWHMTNGKVHRHDPDVDIVDEDGVPADMFTQMMIKGISLSPNGVCLASLYVYVMPRAAGLMARCYVPRDTVDYAIKGLEESYETTKAMYADDEPDEQH